MNSQEMLILFIGVILAASIVVTSLYNVIQAGSSQAESVSKSVQEQSIKDYTVIDISSGDTDTNIYVQGVSGSLDTNNILVLVNGISYNPTTSFVLDKKVPGFLDPGDVLLIRIPVGTGDTDCVKLGINGVYTTIGMC